MILYHRTLDAVAKVILREGFRDGAGTYMTTTEHSGVWLSNVPLDSNEGAKGDALLRLELPEKDIADFEWIEDGKPYREWLIPAALVNEKATGLCAVDEDEEDEQQRDASGLKLVWFIPAEQRTWTLYPRNENHKQALLQYGAAEGWQLIEDDEIGPSNEH